MRSQVDHILRNFDIPASISLYRRFINDDVTDEDGALHTLLISTNDKSPARWETVAYDIQKIFRDKGVADDEIEVEICNPRRMRYNISNVLPDNPHLISAMEALKPNIITVISTLCKQEGSSIAFHLRHPKSNQNASRVPTILISFFPGTIRDFKSIESALLQVLNQSTTPVALELLRGLVHSVTPKSTGTVLSDIADHLKPCNGSSIGVNNDKTTAGSLGCWLNLNFSTAPSKKVALTCHHVVTLEENELKKSIGRAGVDFGDITNKVAINYPACLDRHETLRYYDKSRKSANPDPRADAAFDAMSSIDTNPIIGHVIAASGMRINSDGRRMNWALIETPETFRKNNPPPLSAFDQRPMVELPTASGMDFHYQLTKDSIVRHTDVVKKGTWVTKQGKMTLVTAGVVNRMKRVIHWKEHEDFITEEMEVMGLSKDFCDGGDSGAMVTNSYGELIGMVIGKEGCSNDFAVGIVTPILDIFRDVKAHTGGDLSLDSVPKE